MRCCKKKFTFAISSPDEFLSYLFVQYVTAAFGDLLQYMIVGHLYFPLVSWVSALFYARRILHSASLLRLSVRPSVCLSIAKCPRRRAVSLRQLSFLYSSRAIQRRGTLHTEPFVFCRRQLALYMRRRWRLPSNNKADTQYPYNTRTIQYLYYPYVRAVFTAVCTGAFLTPVFTALTYGC